MADIDIRRQSSIALLWLVTVIALLLCIWLIFGGDDGPTTRRSATSALTATLLPAADDVVDEILRLTVKWHC